MFLKLLSYAKIRKFSKIGIVDQTEAKGTQDPHLFTHLVITRIDAESVCQFV